MWSTGPASRKLPALIKLPKDLLDDPRHGAVTELLETDVAPLWESGRHSVPTVPLTNGLVHILRQTLHTGLAVQGFELIAKKLAAEQLGLDAVSQKSTAPSPPARVSRLLIVANDGSKRFYRDCDGLLTRYAQRLAGCRLDLTGEALGEALFDQPKLVRCVLVLDKKAVSRALLSLLPPPPL
jgi:hypothetical protein